MGRRPWGWGGWGRGFEAWGYRAPKPGPARPCGCRRQKTWAFVLNTVRSQGQVFIREVTSIHLHLKKEKKVTLSDEGDHCKCSINGGFSVAPFSLHHHGTFTASVTPKSLSSSVLSTSRPVTSTSGGPALALFSFLPSKAEKIVSNACGQGPGLPFAECDIRFLSVSSWVEG